MIQVLLFDVDGVIVDAKGFSNTLNDDYGITTEKTLSFFQGKFLECLVGKADLKQELVLHLKEWRWNKSVDDFLQYWFVSEHKINEKLVEYIQQLRKKGVRCYVGTNQEKYRTEYLLYEMDFVNMFDGVSSSAEVGYRKPDKQFFQHILSALKISLEEMLFWDNSLEHIEVAKKLGIKAEFYTDFGDFSKKMIGYLEE